MYDIGKRELKALKRAVDSGHFFRYGGREVVAAEKEWAEKIGADTAVMVTSGTASLIAGLQALGVGPGQSVLLPGYTFISTALAVTAVGAIPLYVEVDESLTMDPEDLRKKIRKHTGCVMPVHMQGMPCDLEPILEIAAEKGIPVFEDCCQADGGSYKGKRLGSWGAVGGFSFNQFKIISCGEGGSCVTSDPGIAERLYMAQDGSCSVWPETGTMSQAFFCGGNFRFNELNAAMLRVQIKKLDKILKRLRKKRAELLQTLEIPDDCAFIRTHDEEGQCGVCLLIQAPTPGRAEAVEKDLAAAGHTVHRPINSGRHVYKAWDVVNSQRGGTHPEWDAFRHPKNQRIATHYDRPMKRTDDLLARTVLLHTPYVKKK
ncbi:MAG: aminotransferase class I/II-fold pyridoxal phosphate-dependent enzyme [Verrucomicrobia bacterium]|nr:aminotransferase class I/II-fold pyridoxal phosphate-dependent enzyme [Verrucomicrobiota bacterium]MCH8525757.1 aminotransferase class I/II-fold pyridoxal phosphate-dependent enzyme [Kiritimatiellia bacterium]